MSESVVSTVQSLCSAVCQILCTLTSKLFGGLSVLWNILSPWFADLHVILSPSGTVIRNVGDTVDLSLLIDSSDATKVSWTKVETFYVRRGKKRGRKVGGVLTRLTFFCLDRIMLNSTRSQSSQRCLTQTLAAMSATWPWGSSAKRLRLSWLSKVNVAS